MKDYEENPIQTVIEQRVHGDGNTQIAGEDVTAAIGEGAIAAKGTSRFTNTGSILKSMPRFLQKNCSLRKSLNN